MVSSAMARARGRKPAAMDDVLRAVEEHHRSFDHRRALDRDPLKFPHRYEHPDDRALVALLSALMAFGRVDTIIDKLDELLALLVPSPGVTPIAVVAGSSRAALRARLGGFVHRTFRGADVADLLFAIGQQYRAEGRVLAPLERAWESARPDLSAALGQWVGSLRAIAWPGGPDRTQKHLLPDPSGSSASKRLMLFLRWVVRSGGVDLGLTQVIPASALVIPVDVHIGRIARNLGLTTRTDASWRTAVEITASLRRLDPHDPVQYDFTLCHKGIDGPCPDEPAPGDCAACVFKPVCRHWR